ncbi:MAG TPA: hypothetical protein VMU84_08565 [Thermoanaerobaculia bacterium]|nr:hypothetical protein [Thermoanaerobaculia bacterium]
MRKSRLVFLLAVVILSVTVIGQQEPLPPIQPKTAGTAADSTPPVSDFASPFPAPIIDLPAEPVLIEQTPTLEDSARRNDYPSFDTLFNEASRRGDAREFTALHDLWTYSINERIGAFYGKEMHDKLARAYSGYESYIEPFRIVDSRGHVFYPTAETKSYLLQQAVLGRGSSVQIASRNRSNEIQKIVVRPARKRLQKAAATPKPTPAATPLPVELAPPVVVQASNAPPNVTPEPVAAPTPAPAPAPPQTVTQAALVTTPAPTPQEPTSAFNARAIIVAIFIFVGIGVLMVMLRASREERMPVTLMPPTVVPPPPPVAEAKPVAPIAAAKPLDNIEPIRKPSSRASGSHG